MLCVCFVAESQLRNYIEWINDDDFLGGRGESDAEY